MLMTEKHQRVLSGLYAEVCRRTIQARDDLVTIQRALEVDSNFKLVEAKNSEAKYGFMEYVYGMLVLLRKDDAVIFSADTKALCGFYRKDGKFRMVPFLGVNKTKLCIIVDRILSEKGIEVELDEESESFEGPWAREMSGEQKEMLGMPEEISKLKPIHRYATAIAREFVPIVEEHLKREKKLECMLRNVNESKIPQC